LNKKIHKLTYEPDYNFRLIGISSHENDYRLSWALNQLLCLDLAKTSDYQVAENADENTIGFSCYSFDDDDTFLQYRLISNRCDNGFLLDEHKNIDYVLKVSGEIGPDTINQLVKKIRANSIVSLAFEIEVDKLKAKKKLLH
jgi:hypothetical protein